MKFSLRLAFAGMAMIAIWLAAMTSGSSVVVEVISALTLLLIPLSLVCAICDSCKERRPFWIGFFIFSASGILGSAYTAGIHYKLALTMCGPSPFSAPGNPGPTAYFPVPSTNLTPPVATATPANMSDVVVGGPVQPFAVPVQSDYVDQLNSVLSGMPICTSLMLGLIGGCAAAWVARERDATIAT